MPFCIHCGKENSKIAKFCYGCGKPILLVNKEAMGNIPTNSTIIGKTCPYCQTPIKQGTEVVVCNVCGMPHHKTCWIENENHCTTFGCTGTVALPLNTVETFKPSEPNPLKSSNHNTKDYFATICPYCGTSNPLRPSQKLSDITCEYCNKHFSCSSQSEASSASPSSNSLQSETSESKIHHNPSCGEQIIVCPHCASRNELRHDAQFEASICNYCGKLLAVAPESVPAVSALSEKNLKFITAIVVFLILCCGFAFYYAPKSNSGTITLDDGSVYSGVLRDGMPNGYGTMKRKDGVKYVGIFNQGNLQATGTVVFPDGATMKCEFQDGLPNGVAKIVRPNDYYIYEQKYVSGKKTGEQFTKAPFTIRNIVLSNTAKDNAKLSAGTQFSQQSIRYISYSLEVVSIFPRSLDGGLGVIYRKPNGEIFRNPTKSPPELSTTSTIHLIRDGSTYLVRNGWGNEERSIYQKGRWKIEFWWGDIKVDEVDFDVI